ncbi:Ribulose bisphosphate carboxylase [uncultured archaeon]|nr:Ribulose bisphosphate carboxylase [uncultured archaeon]
MAYVGFVNTDYTPKRKEVVCLFYAESPRGKTLEWTAEHVAGESSVGTWTDVVTSKDSIGGLAPHICKIDKKKGVFAVAYPPELFEFENVPGIMSSIAGNIFGMKAVENLRLLDIQFPPALLKAHRGPEYGIDGLRKRFGIEKRPFVGTIIKPKLGLPYQKHAKVAYDAWVGGCDVVKDDENLTSQSFNPFEKRAKATLALMKKAEKKTGEKKAYLINVTAETGEMIRRAKLAKKLGANYLMIDVLTAGFAAVQSLREADLGLPLHAHRAMHGMITRNPRHGMTMLALAKIYRLIGVDTLHVGTGEVGKMEGGPAETKAIINEVREKEVKKGPVFLPQEWGSIKPVMPVASGGLDPSGVPQLMKLFGNDFVVQAGGGIHGHPKGTKAGATAMRQAVDACIKRQSLESYSKSHKELAQALAYWKGK